jgi:hypothetical protein
MAKDYSSFSSIAKPRFRGMAKELGYTQITGTIYIKQNGDWFEGFGLQASSWGNDFFYINYGIGVPNLWKPFETDIDWKCEGYWLSRRLDDDYNQGFPNATKDQVQESANLALSLYREQALPWFAEVKGVNDIAERYFESTNLNKEKLGEHNYFNGLSAANYGLFQFKAGNFKLALDWLKEAERLYSLPLYTTRDGRWVHEREKYARIVKPEDYEIEQLETIKKIIAYIENS